MEAATIQLSGRGGKRRIDERRRRVVQPNG
jgi:hypothetical protein